MFALHPLSVLALLSLLPAVLSQNTSTYNECLAISDWQTPNASASYPIAGISYTNDSIKSTSIAETDWTVSITLTNWTTNGAGYSPIFWLAPPLSQPGSPAPTAPKVPYAGCASTLYGFPDNVNAAGETDSGDCTKMLDEECVGALQEQFVLQAKSASTAANTTLEEACQSMLPVLTSVPKACLKFLYKGETRWSAISTPLDFQPLNLSSCAPSSAKIPLPFLSAGPDYGLDRNQAANYTTYDKLVNMTIPVIMTVFSNATVWGQNKPFADTRLVCLRPSNIAPGSHVPSPKDKSAGPALNLKAAVGFGVVVNLLLAVLL